MKRLEKPNWRGREERKKRFWMIACVMLLLVPLGAGSVYILSKTLAESSEAVGDTQFSDPEINGDKIFVRKGDSFQKALDQAKPGDTILLEAGATFSGAFELPNKSGDKFITIRTSAQDSQLPPADTRIDPKKYASVLPKLQSNVKGKSVISTAKGAHHFRFVGIEFMPTIEGLYNIVEIGKTDEAKIEDLPHHIEFDRVYLYGDKNTGQRRGIAANGRYLKISNSYFKDFKQDGYESQAIAIWATDGHIEIVNNYLEAAAEAILFGGAESNLKLIPADCLVKDNWLNKPLEWRNTKWVVKNHFEIKSGKRIKVENNLMTNNWAMAQEGTAVVFRTGEDSGKQATLEDIEFTNNIVYSSGSALNIYGGEGDGGKNMNVRNNLFYDIDAKKYDGRGYFIKIADFENVTVENNTVIHTGSIAIAYGEPNKNFVFRNNIVFNNEYGFFGDGTGVGKVAVNKYFPSADISNNIIVGGSDKDYDAKNFYPASINQVGFVNVQANDYKLNNSGTFQNKSSDGKQIGANLDPKTVGGK